MNYQESLDYLLRYADYERLPRSGIVWDLKRVERLLERLGNPHLAAHTVHVAGTKGKGSTAAMLAAILTASGYRTGFYSSPHLLSFTERIQVNGANISEDDWAGLVEEISPYVEAENADGSYGELTTFEIMTAMAFLHFRNVNADYQVMEVGLGGRLDATNVVHPDVCVITSISYDHTDVLGNTLEAIAGEKAGIIKPGIPVVSAPQDPAAMGVIENVCREKGCRLVRAGTDITVTQENTDLTGQTFTYRGLNMKETFRLPLLGDFQTENAGVAAAAAELLAGAGAHITAASVQHGFSAVHWPGRLDILSREPWVVADCAHNAYSIKRLGAALKASLPYERLTFIIGFGNDKDVTGMMDEAVKLTGDIVIVASRHPKAIPPEKLAAEFRQRGANPRVAATVGTAITLAKEGAGTNDLICAAGSVFVVAEVMEAFTGQR